jgi:hypothetical protein
LSTYPIVNVYPPVGGELKEHADGEATVVGASSASQTTYYDAVANGGTIVSAQITLSKRCMVVVVSLCVLLYSAKATDIQRDGVNKTKETILSPSNFAIGGKYGHLQYATEVLDAGTYTYSLVNTSGTTQYVFGAAMKIVAVEVS